MQQYELPYAAIDLPLHQPTPNDGPTVAACVGRRQWGVYLQYLVESSWSLTSRDCKQTPRDKSGNCK